VSVHVWLSAVAAATTFNSHYREEVAGWGFVWKWIVGACRLGELEMVADPGCEYAGATRLGRTDCWSYTSRFGFLSSWSFHDLNACRAQLVTAATESVEEEHSMLQSWADLGSMLHLLSPTRLQWEPHCLPYVGPWESHEEGQSCRRRCYDLLAIPRKSHLVLDKVDLYSGD
jgi:hypothetical protein